MTDTQDSLCFAMDAYHRGCQTVGRQAPTSRLVDFATGRVALCLAVLILALFAGQSLATDLRQVAIEDRYIFPISAREISDTIIQVRMNGQGFYLPVNRIDGVLESDKISKSELREGFTVVGRLPTFAGRTSETLSEFLQPKLMANIVYLSLWRSCRTEVPTTCKADGAVKRWFDTETMNFFSPSRDIQVEAVSGLALVGHTAALGKTAATEDLFVPEGSNTGREFLICNRPKTVPVPHCKHRVLWRDGLYITVRYRRTQVEAWQLIIAGARNLVEDDLSEDPSSGQPVIEFPRIN